jgi:hypothetical protein
MSQVFGGFKNADVFLKFVKINLGIRLIFYASLSTVMILIHFLW